MKNPILDPHIFDLVPSHSKVLDLGCGNGELLLQLKQKKQIQGYGIDLEPENIGTCISQKINIYQSSIESALSRFTDRSFDIVILSQTLQEIRDPLWVIEQALRVGKQVIVSFPNFAHWQVRLQIAFGKIPVTKHLPFSWHDTPNIRVISVSDFKNLCAYNGFAIQHAFSYSDDSGARTDTPSNFWSKGAIYFLSKADR